MAFGGRRVSLRSEPTPKVLGVTVGQASDEEMLVKWDNGTRTVEYNEDLNWDVQDGTGRSQADDDSERGSRLQGQDEEASCS